VKIKKILNNFINFVIPDYCFICKEVLENNETQICDHCISLLKEPECFCKKCGKPTDLNQDWCNICKYKKIYYEKMFVAYYYDETLKKFLKKVKYNPSEKIFENFDICYNLFLNNEQLKELAILKDNLDFVLPIPIHLERQKLRGYNQSVLLAQVLEDCYGIHYKTDILKKHKNTKFFFSLNKKEREKELENAFEIINFEAIKNKNILLLDDISTTGTTMNNISKLLLENGANSIFTMCLAHGE
jgi:competence protein ComFC